MSNADYRECEWCVHGIWDANIDCWFCNIKVESAEECQENYEDDERM